MNGLKMMTAALILGSATVANAATFTLDATNAGPGTYFVPALGQELSSPYYRGFGEDWGWTHNPIVQAFTSAFLNISAYDVDEAPGGSEVDEISAWDAASSTWIMLGQLTGMDNAFSFTDFDIYNAAGGALQDDIAAGLQVRMHIDALDNGWFVSLGKSVITTNGSGTGNPNPGTSAVPLPAAGWLLIAGLGGLAAARRRKS